MRTHPKKITALLCTGALTLTGCTDDGTMGPADSPEDLLEHYIDNGGTCDEKRDEPDYDFIMCSTGEYESALFSWFENKPTRDKRLSDPEAWPGDETFVVYNHNWIILTDSEQAHELQDIYGGEVGQPPLDPKN